MLLSGWVANYLGLSENGPQHPPKNCCFSGENDNDESSVDYYIFGLIGVRPQTPSCKRTVDLGRPPLAFQPGHQVQELETTENWILIGISGDTSRVNPTGDPMIFNKG